jgi:hypothetical protein
MKEDNVTLLRLNDGLKKSSYELSFIKWGEDDRASDLLNKPTVGTSAILAPYNRNYTWLTSPIVEVISITEFKTKNSHYKIINLKKG